MWNKEPALRDMLADPVVTQVMRKDGIPPEKLVLLLSEARARLRNRPAWPHGVTTRASLAQGFQPPTAPLEVP